MKSKLTIAVTLLLCMLCVLLSVPLSAKAEEPADTAAANEMLADTDSLTIYGGNAEDAVSGRQLFSNQIYGSSFGEQLDGIAAEIYERHRFFTQRLIAAGVDPETAAKEACHMEHGVSENSFEKLKQSMERQDKKVH